ncbi:MAG: hypothetical protein ABSC92_12955 [Rhizomicrobium sp.]|jgi:hypothetical protein
MQQTVEILDDSPLARAIVNTELAHLRDLAAALESYESARTDDFAVIIDMVLRGRFNQNELAAEFKVSPGTISRWRAGRSCPPAYARAGIVGRIRELLVASANDIKAKAPHLVIVPIPVRVPPMAR